MYLPNEYDIIFRLWTASCGQGNRLNCIKSFFFCSRLCWWSCFLRLELKKNNWSCESYKFDDVFNENARHKLVYEAVAEPVLEASLAFQMPLINFGVHLCLGKWVEVEVLYPICPILELGRKLRDLCFNCLGHIRGFNNWYGKDLKARYSFKCWHAWIHVPAVIIQLLCCRAYFAAEVLDWLAHPERSDSLHGPSF